MNIPTDKPLNSPAEQLTRVYSLILSWPIPNEDGSQQPAENGQIPTDLVENAQANEQPIERFVTAEK